MSLFLGDKIKEKGGKIKLQYSVKEIKQEEGKVVVCSKEG